MLFRALPFGVSVYALFSSASASAYGSRNLIVALDDSGDAAVMWTIARELAANPQPSQLLVATRAAYALRQEENADLLRAIQALWTQNPRGKMERCKRSVVGLYNEDCP